jgi:hypothetical protein
VTALVKALTVHDLLTPEPAVVIGVVIGVALVAAVRLPRELLMPPSCAEALFAKKHAEYRLPRGSSGSLSVGGLRFALAEGGSPGTTDFRPNGLVDVVGTAR